METLPPGDRSAVRERICQPNRALPPQIGLRGHSAVIRLGPTVSRKGSFAQLPNAGTGLYNLNTVRSGIMELWNSDWITQNLKAYPRHSNTPCVSTLQRNIQYIPPRSLRLFFAWNAASFN